MAEFSEVMRQAQRMCDHRRKRGLTCIDCDAMHICGFKIWDVGLDTLCADADAVMAWAAEHPEPKYPTWIEWLEEIGVAGRLPSVEPVFTENQEFYLRKLGFTPKAHIPIPADLAEKLGLEPKNNIQKPSLKR